MALLPITITTTTMGKYAYPAVFKGQLNILFFNRAERYYKIDKTGICFMLLLLLYCFDAGLAVFYGSVYCFCMFAIVLCCLKLCVSILNCLVLVLT